jgi:NADPH-dependent curcumin reductase CurA
MSNLKSREIRLKSRPNGTPTEANFELKTAELSGPGEGEVLVRNLWMSVDPYMRGRMTDAPSYIAPFKLGEALQGGAIGEVVASNAPGLKPGDYVSSMLGWREYFVAPGNTLEKIEPAGVPIEAYLGPLGMPGLTAYVGLLKIGEAKAGDAVLVSGAGGAVGSVVCQIAKAIGCTVVGFAGTDAKCKWLEEIGVDHAINYKTAGDLSAAVKRAEPEGVDVYFENVGGPALVAALDNMKTGGRLAVCGFISRYNATAPEPGPANIINVLARRLKMQGFIVSAYFNEMAAFRKQMIAWHKAGKMSFKDTVALGIENAPRAFLGLFKGDNVGKMLVRLGPDRAV